MTMIKNEKGDDVQAEIGLQVVHPAGTGPITAIARGTIFIKVDGVPRGAKAEACVAVAT